MSLHGSRDVKLESHHPHEDPESLTKLIEAKFQSSCMSNAKWVRLLKALTAHEGLVRLCLVKLVWDDELRELQIDGRTFEHDFWPTAVEGGVSGFPADWYSYREFEMLEFPASASVYKMPNHRKAGRQLVAQDLSAIRAVFDQTGVFDLEENVDCLRMFAYR